MSTDDLLFDLDDDGIALITLNRPDKMNAFGGQMRAALGEAYRRCDEDDSVRAVVLTGAGRAFCSGADLSDAVNAFSLDGVDDFSAAAIEMPAFRIRKLVVAAVNGHAIGLGLTLAMQCDIRLFALEGKYGIVQVRRGVMPDAYAHYTVTQAVGLARAAEILLTGKTFRGEEIERLGIASQVLPSSEVLPTALAIARDVACNAAPVSVAVTKRLMWEAPTLTPDEVERKETALHLDIMPRADAIEGPVAFLEGRPPEWKLRVSKDFPDWPE